MAETRRFPARAVNASRSPTSPILPADHDVPVTNPRLFADHVLKAISPRRATPVIIRAPGSLDQVPFAAICPVRPGARVGLGVRWGRLRPLPARADSRRRGDPTLVATGPASIGRAGDVSGTVLSSATAGYQRSSDVRRTLLTVVRAFPTPVAHIRESVGHLVHHRGPGPLHLAGFVLELDVEDVFAMGKQDVAVSSSPGPAPRRLRDAHQRRP